jgi:hypothetical protein
VAPLIYPENPVDGQDKRAQQIKPLESSGI